MKWFKCIDPNHPAMLEVFGQIGAAGCWQVTVVVAEATAQGVSTLDLNMVSNWASIKRDRAEKILPHAQKILTETLKIFGKSSEIYQESSKISQKSQDFTPSSPHGSTRDQEENREEKKEENTPPAPQGGSGFEEFWSLYPKKLEKGKVKEYWNRHKLDSKLPEILQGLSAWKKTDNWARDGGQYIPYPIRFLKNERWKDEIDSSGPVSAGVKPEKGSTLADRLMQHERIVDMFNPSDVLETAKLRNDGHGQLWNGNTPIAVEQYKPL